MERFVSQNQHIETITETFLQNSTFSMDSICEIITNTSDGIVITDKNGIILFCNNGAKTLFGRKVSNIKEIGYLFNFDICIIDKKIDILSYSPISVILDNNIKVRIETHYETQSGLEKHISIVGICIQDQRQLFIFFDNSTEKFSNAYLELTKTNQKLLEKINENDQLRTQAQSQAIRESLVNRISNAIRNSLEIDMILQTAVEELGKTLGTDRTMLVQNIAGEKELPISHEYTLPGQKKLRHQTINIEEDFYLQQVIETHEATSGNHIDTWDTQNQNKFKLIAPVIHHNELFGVIILIRQSRKWHTEEIDLVQSIADQISISIKNARLFEDTTSKNTKISVLNEILKAINSSLILDDVFHTIGREIKRLINFDRASIAILDEETKQIKLFARIKNTGNIEILRSGPFIAKGTAISWAIENLKPILINMDENKEFSDTITLKKSNIKTAIIIPMIHKGNVVGVFYIGSKHDKAYGDSEVEIMSQIAGQISIAVENAKLYWQTQTQALKETLINQIVTSIRKSLNVSEVLKATVKELGVSFGVNNCLFKYCIEEDKDNSLYEYVSKNTNPILTEFKNILKQIDIQKEFENNTNIIWKQSDEALNPYIKDFLNNSKIQSMLIFPIIFKDPITNTNINVGLIALGQTDLERDWQIEDISLLKVLSDQIAITINQARLFEQSQQQKTEIENTLSKLNNAHAQLVQSEKMAALGQLVAGVAHEINTPIGSINSNNDIFTKCIAKIKNNLLEEAPNINKINQLVQLLEETTNINSMACERINEIVKSLKNFARLDESELKKVDIHDGINSTLTLLRHELKGKVEIQTNFSELPQVECYPNLLNQVFMNLLINAYQSIKDKGTITITTKHIDNKIYVSISDTGTGISEDNLKKIFDPGFTTKGVGIGTGLGLSICYQILEKHKGELLVDSKVGTGSTFTIIIPVA